MTEMLTEFYAILSEDDHRSKVPGRRNWLIRTDNHKITYAGGWGEGRRQGWVDSEPIAWIVKNNTHWYTFTYMQDFLNCMDELVAAGYSI